MIEKIQQVEDNWQKPWITIAANTRNFFPQNLTGRRYTGGNAFYSFPLREIPVPDTRIYDIQPGERGRDLRAERIEIVSGLLLPFLRVPQGNTQEITFEEYKALSREQQQEYNVIPTYKYYSVFNLDQTNFRT